MCMVFYIDCHVKWYARGHSKRQPVAMEGGGTKDEDNVKWEIAILYEAKLDKRFMNLEALLPLLVDEAFMPHMKAVDVPCHFLYGGLTCYQRLQSDRPKC